MAAVTADEEMPLEVLACGDEALVLGWVVVVVVVDCEAERERVRFARSEVGVQVGA